MGKVDESRSRLPKQTPTALPKACLQTDNSAEASAALIGIVIRIAGRIEGHSRIEGERTGEVNRKIPAKARLESRNNKIPQNQHLSPDFIPRQSWSGILSKKGQS